VTRTKSGYRDPKLHQIKIKGSEQLTLKASRPLKTLEFIDSSASAPSLALAFTDGSRATWVTSPNQAASSLSSLSAPLSPDADDAVSASSAASLQFRLSSQREFAWWLLHAYAVFYKADVAHNLSPEAVDSLLLKWSRVLLGFSGDDAPAQDVVASGLTSAQRHIIDAANAINRKKLEDTVAASLASGDTVLLPSVTAREAADLEHFLALGGLDCRSVDRLEAFLQQRLVSLQESTVEFVVGAQTDANSVAVASLLDQLVDQLDEMEQWTCSHDAALSKMDIGMEKIEFKSSTLDTQDRSQVDLQHTLMWVLSEITMPEWAVNLLQQPDYAVSNVSRLVAASLRLDRLIRGNRIPRSALEEDASKLGGLRAHRGMLRSARAGADDDEEAEAEGKSEAEAGAASPSVGPEDAPASSSLTARGLLQLVDEQDARGAGATALTLSAGAVGQSESYQHGQVPLLPLAELAAVWQQRKEARLLAAAFVRKSSDFLMGLIDAQAKRAGNAALFYSAEDRDGLEADTHTVLLTKMSVKCSVAKYEQLHQALLPYNILVGCCERLQPGTTTLLYQHYVEAFSHVLEKDSEILFTKLKKTLCSSEADCRLASCPEVPLAGLKDLHATFYTSGFAAKLLSGCIVAGNVRHT
jgi:hypothetical protein